MILSKATQRPIFFQDIVITADVASEASAEGLSFSIDPDDYTNGANNVWVAWHNDPAERRRVVWSSKKEIGNPHGIFRFRDFSSPEKFWNGSEWLDSQLIS